jgi:hypothetical protein
MATAAQIEANQRNAKRSTGPRTEAGKARSRLNALKHGKRVMTIAGYKAARREARPPGTAARRAPGAPITTPARTKPFLASGWVEESTFRRGT